MQPGQPTAATIATTLTNTSGEPPAATVEIGVQLPEGMARNSASFATCAAPVLESAGPAGCVPGSVIGTGTAVLDARPAVADPINAGVTIFNAPNGEVLLYVF